MVFPFPVDTKGKCYGYPFPLSPTRGASPCAPFRRRPAISPPGCRATSLSPSLRLGLAAESCRGVLPRSARTADKSRDNSSRPSPHTCLHQRLRCCVSNRLFVLDGRSARRCSLKDWPRAFRAGTRAHLAEVRSNGRGCWRNTERMLRKKGVPSPEGPPFPTQYQVYS